MFKCVTKQNLLRHCEKVAAACPHLAQIFSEYGTPPLWSRPPGYETLVHIILEQQVSLASARACLAKLKMRLGDLTPKSFLELDDTELKTGGISRQKASYVRSLSEAVLGNTIDFDDLDLLGDAEAKAALMSIKGVGPWTADIYLLMAMLRPDVMPKGDLALHAAYQKVTNADTRPTADEFVEIAEKWRPHRSAAARLLWHFYLSEVRKPAHQ